jgi:hypothetical protein
MDTVSRPVASTSQSPPGQEPDMHRPVQRPTGAKQQQCRTRGQWIRGGKEEKKVAVARRICDASLRHGF